MQVQTQMTLEYLSKGAGVQGANANGAPQLSGSMPPFPGGIMPNQAMYNPM